MKIIICDDNIEHIEKLYRIVFNFLKEKYIYFEIKAFDNGEKLLNYYLDNEENIDIIFLDIIMDSISGIECAKIIRKNDKKVKIIMVTSSRDYLLDGYEVDANGYILKPYSDLIIRKILSKKINEIDMENRDVVFIKSKQNIYKVSLEKVIFFESILRKIKIKYRDNSTIEYYDKLDSIEERLNKKNFIRVHRSYLVNANYIECIEKKSLKLITGEIIPISRPYINHVREKFMEYMEPLLNNINVL